MQISNAKVKSVTANIGKGTIFVSLQLDLNEDNLALAQELSDYAEEDAGTVDAVITPRQPKLLK